jgi:DNA repair photolyase
MNRTGSYALKPETRRGRGATLQMPGRFESMARLAFDDGWQAPMEDAPLPLKTTVTVEHAKSVIQKQTSPDLPFDKSVNAYRGCEHGCIYCYARPSHAYLNLSPGLDFETKLFAKPNAPELLREALATPGYVCSPIALGTNTDPYQPIEREWKITRQILEVLAEHRHPVSIVTKNALIERDLDILADMARDKLATVYISVTTLNGDIARRMEPRATAPHRRLAAMRKLNSAGVPCGVMVAPVVPFLTDAEMEDILEAARIHGAQSAGYTLLRLPYEVKDLFRDWLKTHYPLKADHIMSRLHAMRGDRDNDSTFGQRFSGDGLFAELLKQRFAMACARLGLNRRETALDTTQFRIPEREGQLALF